MLDKILEYKQLMYSSRNYVLKSEFIHEKEDNSNKNDSNLHNQ